MFGLRTKVFHPDATHDTFGISHMPDLSELSPEQVATQTRTHVETSLLQLGVGYVDLLLLHWPSGKEKDSSSNNNSNSTTNN